MFGDLTNINILVVHCRKLGHKEANVENAVFTLTVVLP